VKTQTDTHTEINFLLHFESFFWGTTILKDSRDLTLGIAF
jgi:hypothetical protein